METQSSASSLATGHTLVVVSGKNDNNRTKTKTPNQQGQDREYNMTWSGGDGMRCSFFSSLSSTVLAHSRLLFARGVLIKLFDPFAHCVGLVAVFYVRKG